MDIKRTGSQPSAKGLADWFTGDGPHRPAISGKRDRRGRPGNAVTFEPGARTAWHTHPLGQILIVTAGCGGSSAKAGRSRRSVPAMSSGSSRAKSIGTALRATTAMTHVAIQEALDGKPVDWMEKVTDEQYLG